MSQPWSDKRVEGVGPRPAKIFLAGEAPGETEDKLGQPFVGMAGRVLDDMLEEVGIKRDEIYITNVCKNRPTNNNFDNFTEEYIAKAKAEIEEEIALVQPNLIVCAGEKSFSVITELKNITKWRGSVLTSRGRKVLPIIHPAAVMREWTFRPATVVDLAKARRECEYPDVRKLDRRLRTMPGFDEACEYLRKIIDGKLKCSFDIETETNQITCISFATSADMAISIPFWYGSSGSFWSEKEELELWRLIKEALEDPKVLKIAQNAQYDITILGDKYGISVDGLWLDTMIAFHSIYPELPKGLDFLCSLYTDVPYYKFLRKTDDMIKFFEYNALDAVVTFECAGKIYDEMVEFGVDKFYYEHMHSLIYPLMSITRRGVLIDTKLKKEAIKEYKQDIVTLQAGLNRTVGFEINVNSPKQMKEWLYNKLQLTPKYKLRKGKGEKTLAADEEALKELFSETGNEGLKIVLQIRERKKILSTYLEINYDKEKDANGEIVERARTSYLITGTETGRLSSRETVYGTGTNLQNVPKGIARRIFIPDSGKLFVNADLSQAEARVVAYLAGEERLIRVFQEGGDIHRKNAANIYRKPIDKVTSEERELAKRVVHASNYGMGPITFAKTAGISVAEAKRLLNQYFTEYPRIKLWHMQIASQLKKSRTLTTPFGRKRTFFNRWNESLVKEALAYIPQSTVADLLNLGLRRFYEETKGTQTEILLQIHDAVLCQCLCADVQGVSNRIRQCLVRPITVGGKVLEIPCDVSVGKSWDELQKVKP